MATREYSKRLGVIADEQLQAALSRFDLGEMARTLVEAQRLTWAFDGRYNLAENTIAPSGIDYRVWVVGRIRELLAQAQSVNSNTPESDVAWAGQLVAQSGNALETPYEPCIVFEDYKEPNVVVEQTVDGWRVSGVFDLMTCHFGDGEADLARQVGMYLRDTPVLADEFVGEYLRHKKVDAGFAKRQKLYMLYDSAIIWAFWQGHAGGFPEDKTLTLEKWASPFVEYWNKYEIQKG